MKPVIAPEPPDSAGVAALLAASDEFSAAYYPPESNHTVGLDVLRRPEVTFFVARWNGDAIGCGALVRQSPTEAELKRMFVAGLARGRGIGRALLDVLEARARQDGVTLIRLETGIRSHAALALYRRAGYVEREPFGPYRPDPLSVFLEKPLSRQP